MRKTWIQNSYDHFIVPNDFEDFNEFFPVFLDIFEGDTWSLLAKKRKKPNSSILPLKKKNFKKKKKPIRDFNGNG